MSSAELGMTDDSHSSPRCVISNCILESSTSTSPAGSKAVSEMDDYSDVKQLITHNRSSSPSDADDEAFFGPLNGQKVRHDEPFRALSSSEASSGFGRSMCPVPPARNQSSVVRIISSQCT